MDTTREFKLKCVKKLTLFAIEVCVIFFLLKLEDNIVDNYIIHKDDTIKLKIVE